MLATRFMFEPVIVCAMLVKPGRRSTLIVPAVIFSAVKLTIAALSMYAFSIYVPAGYVTPPIVRGDVYTENGATGVDVPAGFTISNASDVMVNTLRGVASFAVLIRPKPETCPLLSILTEYLPSIPLIDAAFVVIDVVLLPTVVESVVTSDDKAVTTPSMFDTSVCRVVTAEAFAEISLSAAVRSDCSVVTLDDIDVMLPSADVTRVSRDEIADAFAVISP